MNIRGTRIREFLWAATIVLSVLAGCKDNGIQPPPNENPIPTDEAPSWSPDGQRICFTHISIDPNDTTYPTGLYVIDTSGNNRRRVILGPAYNPDWSPDGKRIAFNKGDIFTILPTGDSLFRVTNVGSAFSPGWSPDAKKIAFDTPYQDAHGANAIWIINADGTSLHDISQHGTGEWRDPAWSPNGLYILHYRYIGVGTSEIFRMDTLGNNPVRLTYNNNDDQHARWSPDGLSIAWAKDTGIWLMNADGTNQRELFGEYASDPSWSSDSKQIVFTKTTLSKDKIVLWKINVDASEARQLTH